MSELHLRVFSNKSELVLPDGTVRIFLEGGMNQSAKLRYQKIANELANGYLEKQILLCLNRDTHLNFTTLSQEQIELINKLVQSVTSEVGRAIVGLTVMQLCIKSIEPTQSIRLHKGSTGVRDFSWCDGISMRSLDKQYITPVLRKYDLLKLNADGFMMTRSLAENYPYSPVYKAKIRGARLEWISLVEAIEEDQIEAEVALLYLLSQLANQASAFKNLAQETIDILATILENSQEISLKYIQNILLQHINRSDYAARILEIAIHSLMQAMQNYHVFSNGILKPLSQMRSANKKHGNIGDIEIWENKQIIEVWDAKYGKSYLRDEIEELADKLEAHSAVSKVGFVTSVEPERVEELELRCQEIEQIFDISLEIITFERWVEVQFNRTIVGGLVTEEELASAWLTAYVESLAQRRRDIAPIDEPCYQWLATLKEIMLSHSAFRSYEIQ